MLKIDYSIQSGSWDSELSLFPFAQRVLYSAHSFLPFSLPEGSELGVQFTDAVHIRSLNRQWRGIDSPTNVLSFSSNDGVELMNWSPLLGDIVLSYETIHEESVCQLKDFNDHLAHLLIHGFLHLVGYNHVKSADATTMESLEISILHSLCISNPYVESVSL